MVASIMLRDEDVVIHKAYIVCGIIVQSGSALFACCWDAVGKWTSKLLTLFLR
jgi:hypothetical protein